MNSAELLQHLRQAFDRGEVTLEPGEDDWLTTDGDFPAIRGHWHEGSAGEPGRLDIDVVLDENRRIEESFAGVGGGDVGCRAALQVFEQSVLPALLAACWYVTDSRKLQIVEWKLGVHVWDVFIGQFALRGVDITDLELLDQVPAALELALRDAVPLPGLHWLRLVHQHVVGGESRTEVSFDNEPWVAGTTALQAAVVWPSTGGDYVARCFMLLDVRDY